MNNQPLKLMIFDLALGGHYPGYIQHLVRYWCEQKFTGCLDIVVLPQFLEDHADVVAVASDYGVNNVKFRAIAPEEETKLRSRDSAFDRLKRSFQEWRLIEKYAKALQADRCLIMYFDTRQYPLALGATLPCPFSSIYFRPTFHYPSLTNKLPSRKEQLQQWREKFLLSRILVNPKLQTLFCLDPFVVKHLDQFRGKATGVHLPDPVQVYQDHQFSSEQLKSKLGIDRDRQIFLLFGGLNERKGINQLLEAVKFLPSVLAKQICLLFVGAIDDKNKMKMEQSITEARESLPIQIIVKEQFIPEQTIQSYFEIADVILAPYQRHVGMSGILIRAAVAQKPVLSSDYGLMGEISRRYQLGLTVDSTSPQAIADGLTQFLSKPRSEFGDRQAMQSFAAQNTAEQFARVIFERIGVRD
jgi:glycosyltransferase involved in cell wall biosynthesis